MGCLKSKPKSSPHTVVVHTCDYHSHSNGSVVHRLKSRSPSPARYIATDSSNCDTDDARTPDYTKVSRQRHETPPRIKAPSPQITLPSTPEEERNTLNVLDAEDLEPADCNPAPQTGINAETKTSMSVKSQATVSKVMLKPVGSVDSSQTQGSKQSVLSSRDTLTIEELDSDLDDFSRMRLVYNRQRPMSESHLVRNQTFVIKHGSRLPYRPNSERIRPMPDVAWSQ